MAARYYGSISREVAALCYAQPLVRSWARYKTRGLGWASKPLELAAQECCSFRMPWSGSGVLVYWTEEWRNRTELLGGVVGRLESLGWPKLIDTGWTDWDLELCCGHSTAVQICTTQEEHGRKRRLIRARYRVRLREFAKTVFTVSLMIILGAAFVHVGMASACAAVLLVALATIWWRGTRAASQRLRIVGGVASEITLIPLPIAARSRH